MVESHFATERETHRPPKTSKCHGILRSALRGGYLGAERFAMQPPRNKGEPAATVRRTKAAAVLESDPDE